VLKDDSCAFKNKIPLPNFEVNTRFYLLDIRVSYIIEVRKYHIVDLI